MFQGWSISGPIRGRRCDLCQGDGSGRRTRNRFISGFMQQTTKRERKNEWRKTMVLHSGSAGRTHSCTDSPLWAAGARARVEAGGGTVPVVNLRPQQTAPHTPASHRTRGQPGAPAAGLPGGPQAGEDGRAATSLCSQTMPLTSGYRGSCNRRSLQPAASTRCRR